MADGKVAILGAGLIGRSRAVVFARIRRSVRSDDPIEQRVERAPPLIDAALRQPASSARAAVHRPWPEEASDGVRQHHRRRDPPKAPRGPVSR
ncbi:MAG: 3-hydroxyacyl-CoA dehydrogenase NAD-binding domain-containing protein [Acetobacteraceae bacterium]